MVRYNTYDPTSLRTAQRRYFGYAINMLAHCADGECELLKQRLATGLHFLAENQAGKFEDHCPYADEAIKHVVADIAAALGVTISFPSSLESLAAQAE